jgi:hypothetical protein
MPPSPDQRGSDRGLVVKLTLLLLSYLGIESVYILRFPLVMDEFATATNDYRNIYQMMPYRDYAPYRNVLGYYIQLPIILLPFRTWTVILIAKFEMAFVTAAVLLWVAWLMRKLFSPGAIVASLAVLLAMSTFLERSAELRVDMLTGLAGLSSLVLLLRQRPASAGALASVSFLISQKGAYYVISAMAGLGLALLIAAGTRRETWRAAIRFGIGSAATLVAYMAFWSALSSLRAVTYSMFASAVQVAMTDVYHDLRWHYWQQTLGRNPFFYLLVLVSIVSLGAAAFRRRGAFEALLCGYGAAMALQAASHRQPWPYFFVVVLPVGLVLNADLFDRVMASDLWRTRKTILVTLYAVGGLALPLSRLAATLQRDNAFQRRTVEVAEQLVGPADRYFAGIDILFRREQTLEEVAGIDRVVVIKLLALPSEELSKLISRFDARPTKLLIYNYRVAYLPPKFQLYLVSQFEQTWGNIFAYSPVIPSGPFALKFGGSYRVEGREPIIIDGHSHSPGELVSLSRGSHNSSGRALFRLQLQLPVPHDRAPTVDFFPNVYEF